MAQNWDFWKVAIITACVFKEAFLSAIIQACIKDNLSVCKFKWLINTLAFTALCKVQIGILGHTTLELNQSMYVKLL